MNERTDQLQKQGHIDPCATPPGSVENIHHRRTIVPQVSTIAPWIGRQTVVHAAPSTRLQGLQGVQGPLQLYIRRAVCALHASRIDL